MTRITERYNSNRTITTLQNSSSKLDQLQAQLASGRKLSKPSDSPVGTAAALRLRSQAARQTQFDTNSSDAQNWLTTVDSTLNGVNTQLQVARTAVLRGLNTGVSDATTAETLARQVDSLRSGIVDLANSKYQGRPVFGGTTTGSAAFDSSGTYLGDSGKVTRAVGEGVTETVNATGTDVFGSGSTSLFSVLSDISTHLRTDPSALAGDLSKLDTAMQTVSSQQALAGNASQRITDLQNAAATQTIAVTAQLSDLQDVDTAEMAIRVTSASASYQAALQTTASIRQTSLLDFLR